MKKSDLIETLWAKLQSVPGTVPPQCVVAEHEITSIIDELAELGAFSDSESLEEVDSEGHGVPLITVLAGFKFNTAVTKLNLNCAGSLSTSALRVIAAVGNAELFSSASLESLTEDGVTIPGYGLKACTPFNIALREHPMLVREYFTRNADTTEANYVPYADDGAALLLRGDFDDFMSLAPILAKSFSANYADTIASIDALCAGAEWARGTTPADGTPEAAALMMLMAEVEEIDGMSALVYTMSQLHHSQFTARQYVFLHDVITKCGFPITYELLGALAMAAPTTLSAIPARTALIEAVLSRAPSATALVEYLGEKESERLLSLGCQGCCLSLVSFLLQGKAPVNAETVGTGVDWDGDIVGSSCWTATAAHSFSALALAVLGSDDEDVQESFEAIYQAAGQCGAADVMKALKQRGYVPSLEVTEATLLDASYTPPPAPAEDDDDDDEQEVDNGAEAATVMGALKLREREDKRAERALIISAIDEEQERLGKFIPRLPFTAEGATCFYCMEKQDDDDCASVCKSLQIAPIPTRKELLELVLADFDSAIANCDEDEDADEKLQEVLREAVNECTHGFRALLSVLPRSKARKFMTPDFSDDPGSVTKDTEVECSSFGGSFLGNLCASVGGFEEPSTVSIQLAAITTVLGYLPPGDVKLALHAGFVEGNSPMERSVKEQSFQTMGLLVKAGTPIKPSLVHALLVFVVMEPSENNSCPQEFVELRQPAMRLIKEFFAGLDEDEKENAVDELNQDKNMYEGIQEIQSLESDSAKEMTAFFEELGIEGNPEPPSDDDDGNGDDDDDESSVPDELRASLEALALLVENTLSKAVENTADSD